jgi:hypothetical protein
MFNSIHSTSYTGSIYLLEYAFHSHEFEFQNYLQDRLFKHQSCGLDCISKIIIHFHKYHWLMHEYCIGQFFKNNIHQLLIINSTISNLPYYFTEPIIQHISSFLSYNEKKQWVYLSISLEHTLYLQILKRVCKVKFTCNFISDMVTIYKPHHTNLPSIDFILSFDWISPTVKTINQCIDLIIDNHLDISLLETLLQKPSRQIDVWNFQYIDYSKMFLHIPIFYNVLSTCIRFLYTHQLHYRGKEMALFLYNKGIVYTHQPFLESLEDFITDEEFWISFYMNAPYHVPIVLDHLYYFVDKYENIKENVIQSLKLCIQYQSKRILGYVLIRSQNIFSFTESDVKDVFNDFVSYYNNITHTLFKQSILEWCLDKFPTLLDDFHENDHIIKDANQLLTIHTIRNKKHILYENTTDECCVLYHVPDEYIKCISTIPHIIDYSIFEKLKEKICPYCRQSFSRVVYKNTHSV